MQEFVASRPGGWAGQVVGNGHCVAFVRAAAGLPHTSHWRRGDKLHGGDRSSWPPGLIIATFDPDGAYGNHTDGRSHTAVLIEVKSDGLLVWDQWVGHPVASRLIRFKGYLGLACDDGDRYHVVCVDTPGPAAA
jgi:hypothetical protein